MRRELGVGIVSLVSVTAMSCALYGITRYTSGLPKTLKDDRFAITIDGKEQPPQADMHATDYLMSVQVENVSQSEHVFDTGQLELKDLDTGISYFSVSKDKETESLTGSRANTLTKISLKPGQKTEGVLWFPTPSGKATAKKLELRLGSGAIVLQP